MRILVIGPARSGKSTAAILLGKALNLEVVETGHIVMSRLARFYSRSNPFGADMRTWARTIYTCKNEYRPELSALGDLLTEVSPTYLIDEALRYGSIVVGIRRCRELQGYIRTSPEQVRQTLLVRVRASAYRDEDFQLDGCPCDFELVNDSSLKVLQQNVESIARQIERKAA